VEEKGVDLLVTENDAKERRIPNLRNEAKERRCTSSLDLKKGEQTDQVGKSLERHCKDGVNKKKKKGKCLGRSAEDASKREPGGLLMGWGTS